MVDHFHEKVIAQHKVGGEARAMVVTDSIEQAIHYYQLSVIICGKERAHGKPLCLLRGI